MLLVRPVPVTGESSQAFVLRVTEANAIGSPLRLCALEDGRSYLSGQVSGLRGPVMGMRQLSALDSGGLALRYWNTRQPRFCPKCLAERAIWPSLWQLCFYVTCHIHRVRMVEVCAGCGGRLRWNRGSLTHCRCGMDITAAGTEPDLGACLKASADIAAAWCDGRDGGLRKVRERRIEGFLHRIWLLGGYRLGTTRRAQKLSNLHCVDEASRVVEAAMDALSDWPRGFFSLLDQTSRRYGRPSSPRLTDRFGGLYKEIFAPERRKAFEDLREGFEQYVRQRWPGQLAARNRRLSARVIEEHKWISIAEAARTLHWSPRRVRGAIEHGLLAGEIAERASGRFTGVVDRAALIRLKGDVTDWIDLCAVCKMLGIGKKAARSLMVNGCLCAMAGPSVDGHAVWQFRRAEVELFCRSRGAARRH